MLFLNKIQFSISLGDNNFYAKILDHSSTKGIRPIFQLIHSSIIYFSFFFSIKNYSSTKDAIHGFEKDRKLSTSGMIGKD